MKKEYFSDIVFEAKDISVTKRRKIILRITLT